eukprot:UN15228
MEHLNILYYETKFFLLRPTVVSCFQNNLFQPPDFNKNLSSTTFSAKSFFHFMWFGFASPREARVWTLILNWLRYKKDSELSKTNSQNSECVIQILRHPTFNNNKVHRTEKSDGKH